MNDAYAKELVQTLKAIESYMKVISATLVQIGAAQKSQSQSLATQAQKP